MPHVAPKQIRTEKASQERIQVFRAVSKHKIVDLR